jgi:hypothetical protein
MAKILTREALDEIVDACDLDEDKVRTHYSGRGMYGQTCLGFEFEDIGEYADFLVTVTELHHDLTDDSMPDEAVPDWSPQWFTNVSTDSMGRGMIFYFRGITVEGEVER